MKQTKVQLEQAELRLERVARDAPHESGVQPGRQRPHHDAGPVHAQQVVGDAHRHVRLRKERGAKDVAPPAEAAYRERRACVHLRQPRREERPVHHLHLVNDRRALHGLCTTDGLVSHHQQHCELEIREA
jgi:hypothetical protein